jgi:hypothetical protein
VSVEISLVEELLDEQRVAQVVLDQQDLKCVLPRDRHAGRLRSVSGLHGHPGLS